MEKLYKCNSCNHVMPEDEVATAGDPWGDGTLQVCPNCDVAENLSRVPDVDWEFERREEYRLDSVGDRGDEE